MDALAVYWLVLFGLAGLMPGSSRSGGGWLGVRAFTAFAVLIIVSFAAHLMFGLAPAMAARGGALAAAAGILVQIRRRAIPDWTHPFVVLPAAMLAVIAWRGGLAYQPLAWDELGGWLQWIRNISLGDGLLETSNGYARNGYTPGWPLAAAFPNLLLGGFAEERSAVTPFVMHAALLGLVYDVVLHGLRRGGWSSGAARLGGWGVLLAALAVEATWKLAPTNLLIEKPQIYSLCACCLLSVVLADAKIALQRTSAAMGLAFALGYLVKVSMLAFAGPFLLLWAIPVWLRRRAGTVSDGDILAAAVWAVLPGLAVYLIWTTMGPSAAGCISKPLDVIRDVTADGGPGLARATDLAVRFLAAEAEYLRGFKLPLTVVAVLGLGAAAALPAFRAVPLALAAYCGLYFGALYLYHLTCFGEFYFKELNSIDRFTRVPLRTIHLCGLVLLVLALAPRLSSLAGGRWGRGALAGAVALLGGWQVGRLDGSVQDMADRRNAGSPQLATVMMVRSAIPAVLDAVAAEPRLGRQVLIIAQGGDAYESTIADYYSWRRFTLHPGVSWGAEPINPFMRKITEADMADTLLAASLVWPVRVDDWMKGVLAGLVHDPACLAKPEDFLLVPEPAARRLACRPTVRQGIPAAPPSDKIPGTAASR